MFICRKCIFRLSPAFNMLSNLPIFRNNARVRHFEFYHLQKNQAFQQFKHYHVSFNCHNKQQEILYENPIMKLQPYLEIPVLPKNEHVFCPTRKEMELAKKLFVHRPRDKHEIKFIKSAVNLENLPEHDVPEVAFLGRSNVGKSSLIQAMFQEAPSVQVRVSKQPGRTRALNFFEVGKSFCLVDMPGYGYNMPHHFHHSVEKYLQTRQKLCRSFVLIDAEIGITNTDKIGLKMVEEFRIPYVLVLTKIDKAKPHLLLKNLLAAMKIRDESNNLCCFAQPFLVSSVTGKGLLLLQAFIAYITGSLQIEGL